MLSAGAIKYNKMGGARAKNIVTLIFGMLLVLFAILIENKDRILQSRILEMKRELP